MWQKGMDVGMAAVQTAIAEIAAPVLSGFKERRCACP